MFAVYPRHIIVSGVRTHPFVYNYQKGTRVFGLLSPPPTINKFVVQTDGVHFGASFEVYPLSETLCNTSIP